MKVLLINPMASRKPPVKGRPTHFPIGLGQIAASLKAEGHSVEVLNNDTVCMSKNDLSEFFKRSDFDIYGITSMAPQYNYVKALSGMIKNITKKPVILGGPLATDSPKTVLENMDIDVCVLGEGEETVTVTPIREFKKSRNDYPFPAYELFDMAPHLKKQQIQYEYGGRFFK